MIRYYMIWRENSFGGYSELAAKMLQRVVVARIRINNINWAPEVIEPVLTVYTMQIYQFTLIFQFAVILGIDWCFRSKRLLRTMVIIGQTVAL
jgi:hypothetical protein